MGRKTNAEIESETLQMLSLHQQGWDEDQIAEKFGVHRTTVSRRISGLKKKIKKTTQVATRAAESGGLSLDVNKPIQGLNIPKTNPFDVLTDFDDIARASVTAGTVPGSAIAYIMAGFDDDGSKSVEERGTMVMKGFSSIGGFIFGLVETSKTLSKDRENKNQKIKLIQPDVEE